MKIPIFYKKARLASIKIEVEPNKKEFNTLRRDYWKSALYITLLTRLQSFIDIMKNVMELSLRSTKKEVDIKNPMNLFNHFCFFNDWMKGFEIVHYLFHTNEDSFELVRTEGPIALCEPGIQKRINEWLSNEETAEVMINKLKESLMEFAHGPSYKNRLSKIGRPESELVRRFGTDSINEIYRHIRKTLVIVKKNKEKFKSMGLEGIIDYSYAEFRKGLQHEFEKNGNEEGQERIKLSMSFNHLGEIKFPNPLVIIIEGDKYLKSEFESFRWSPNSFTKEIIALLLDLSVSKIEKVLYSNNP